jgi:hypothetical protein
MKTLSRFLSRETSPAAANQTAIAHHEAMDEEASRTQEAPTATVSCAEIAWNEDCFSHVSDPAFGESYRAVREAVRRQVWEGAQYLFASSTAPLAKALASEDISSDTAMTALMQMTRNGDLIPQVVVWHEGHVFEELTVTGNLPLMVEVGQMITDERTGKVFVVDVDNLALRYMPDERYAEAVRNADVV